MTPLIALDLSLDGIVVMSRAQSDPGGGTWWREGIVRLDDDLAGAMQRMRAICAARVGEDFTSILVIPDSQLLITSFERDGRDAEATIRALLAGRTPYPVEELTFDFVARGDRLQVAVVARDTLEEAEAFAAGFGFRPVALVGAPADGAYPGIAMFGQTRLAADLLRDQSLKLDLGEGFTVVPAPAAPDLAAPDGDGPAPSGTGATGKQPLSDPPISGAPAPEFRGIAPAAALPELPAQAGALSADPDVLPEDPSDFASVMDATPEPTPTTGDEPFDGAERPSGEADAPVFATRRRASAAGAIRSEPGLTRIRPRLSQDAAGATVSDAGGEDAPRGLLRQAAATAAPDEADPLEAASSRLAGLSALVGRKGGAAASDERGSGGTRGAASRRARPSTAGAAGPTADRNATGASPLGDEVASSPRRRGSGRLGLYLTLSLLAVLGLLAVWSLTFRDGDLAPGAAGDGLPSDVGLAAPAEPPGETRETALVDLAPEGGVEGTGPAAPGEEDLALLLPDSQGAAPSAAVVPTETDVPAPPAEDATAADARPEIAVVTTDAEPFELPRDIAAAPDAESAEEIYIASIDPAISGGDAVALPRAVPPADTFSPQTSPAPAGTAFETGTDGLVVASASGTLAPGGYSVVAGRPATLPAPRPVETDVEEATADAAEAAVRVELGRNRPVPRPRDAPERAERLTYNGLTRAELIRTPPVRRPAAIAEAGARADAAATRQAAAVQAAASAAVASLAQSDAPAAVPEPEFGTDADPASSQRYALSQSRRPRERPRAVEQDAARIVTQRSEQPAAAAVASVATSQPAAAQNSPPVLRSAGGSVSRAATQSNQIRLREMNLIGVYGQPNSRRALVRLSNGRYVKVEVGDRLERGRVTAIGESEVIYQQNGRTYALRMPQT